MGWGCYKHEWDASSENWQEYMEALCEDRLNEPEHSTWGRDEQICPKCYVEVADAANVMIRALEDMMDSMQSIRALDDDTELAVFALHPGAVDAIKKRLVKFKTLQNGDYF